jgi:flagellar hook assembly protein FlgD
VRVEYAVPAAGPVSLRIYSLGGALVKTLVDQAMGAGRFEAEWNGRDDQGRPVAAGVYWARCGAGGRETARRLVLLK